MKSSHFALLAFLSLLVSSHVAAQADSRNSIWESLKETDMQFAERSRSLGINQAFLSSIAEGAVVFRRGPVDASAAYQRIDVEEEERTSLESRANYIEFSRAGDLGLTAGPYRHIIDSGEGQRRTHGHFVSIWRKFGDEWQMVADMEVRVPGFLSLDVQADISETELAFAESAPAEVSAQNTQESLLVADERFIAAINYRGGQRAALRYGLDNQRIYVPGMAPGIGSESGSIAYGAFMDDRLSMSPVTYQSAGAYMARSGDVGYTYGTMSAEGSGFNASYLRFWRFTAAGEWKIAIEVLNPF